MTMAMIIDQHGRQARLGFILATTLYNLGHVVYLWILLVQSAPHFISRVMMIAVIINVNNMIWATWVYLFRIPDLNIFCPRTARKHSVGLLLHAHPRLHRDQSLLLLRYKMHTHEHMATHDDPHDGNLLSILPDHEAPLGREADQLGENSFKIYSSMVVKDFVLYL